MKTITTLAVLLSLPLLMTAQTGPGGVGNSSSNILWLDASAITGLSDGQAISSWGDISGNTNNFTQGTGSNRPIYKTGILNGKPTVRFDGSNDYFNATSGITSTDISVFMVANKTSTASDYRTLFMTNKYLLLSRSNTTDQWGAYGSGGFTSSNNTLGTSHTILSYIFRDGNTFLDMHNNGGTPVTSSFTGPYNRPTTLGCNNNGSGNFSQFHQGDMAEVFIFNAPLNSAQQLIVHNYLAAKYNRTIPNDIYAYQGTHSFEVAGIGREDASNEHTDAQGSGIVRMNTASALSDGDYLLFGHNNNSLTTTNTNDLPPGILERLSRTWRADKTGDLGTVTITFDLTGITFGDDSGYELLIDNVTQNGSFSDASRHTTGMNFNSTTNILTFTNVNFADGDYFTIGNSTPTAPPPTESLAQTGPGGVGSSSTNILWLDASAITGLVDGQALSNWGDISGNTNNFTQGDGTRQPTYRTGILNGKPVVRFDGASDVLLATSGITATDISVFMVANKTSTTSDHRTLFMTNKYLLMSRFQTSNQWGAYDGAFKSSGTTLGTTHTILSYIFRDGNSFLDMYNNDSGPVTYSFTGPYNKLTTLGSNNNGASTFSQFHQGDMAEVVIYNTPLNIAQRIIVDNYLATKYNRSIANDKYAYDAGHGFELAGIGRENASNYHVDAQGLGIVRINTSSSLSDGDYLLFGHDNNNFSTNTVDVPPIYITSAGSRLNRVWRADKTGDLGTVTISFDLTGIEFGDSSKYELLIDSDGTFASGATQHVTGRSWDPATNIISFTVASFTDGDHFTLGVTPGIISVTNGTWATASTWNCNCVPVLGNNVAVQAGHTVTIDNTAGVGIITINPTGAIAVTNGADFNVDGNFVNNGTFTPGTGTVNFQGTTLQTITSAGTTNFHNLTVNNTAGVNLSGGVHQLENTLTLTAGSFNTGGNSFTMLSNATSTSRIAPVPAGSSITGSFIIERYVSARDAGWNNLAGPATSTILDWDNEMYMSAVGGNDGTACCPTFYSVYTYNESTPAYEAVTSTSFGITPTLGFEMYLADNTTTLNAFTFNTIGTPTVGTQTANVTVNGDGWNLVGNPFASHILWDSLTTNGLDNNFWILDANSGTYLIYGPGDEIPPSQGFWVFANGAGPSLDIPESAKTTTTTSIFRNTNAKKELAIRLRSDINRFYNESKIRINEAAAEEYDSFDAYFKSSPEKLAPGIATFSANNTKGLSINSVNSINEHLIIPVKTTVGVSGKYIIDFNGIENLENYNCFLFEDTDNGKIIDLSNQTSYEFNTTKEDNDTRFKLHLMRNYADCENIIASTPSANNVTVNTDNLVSIQKTGNGTFVDFNMKEATTATISVYNMLGQKAFQDVTVKALSNRVQLNTNNLSGIYFIVVETKEQRISKKMNY